MSAVSSTSGSNALGGLLAGSNNVKSGVANNSMTQLGINDFIALMTTQMKNQDPTKPQDSTEFIAQLAQFSTVSGVSQMNTSISSLMDQLKGSQALNATSLVGKSVLVDANQMSLKQGQAVAGEIATPSVTSNVKVVVTDSSGQVVRELQVSNMGDKTSFNWDGMDQDGNPVRAGTYSFKAIGSVAGKSTSLSTSVVSKVSSVTIDPTNNVLQLNTDSVGSVSLSDVKQVS